jgi:hypothetical protein
MPNPFKPLDEFLRENNLATATDSELEAEQERRKLSKPFPLHIFHPKMKPFIEALHKEYDLPRSYIGLSLLSAYSSAVGSAYHVKLHKLGNIYFPVWACLEGISSAGKSLIMNQIFKPLYQIQEELEEEWFTAIEGKTDGEIAVMKTKQLIYGEAHIPTLIKDVMPANPKGILQDADEILSWINGMNQLAKGGKEGTDEQFWLKSWNCKSHRKRLSGNKVYVIPRPYLNVFGGAQPSVMWKLFRNDRATTGFIFRLLFAVPDTHRIADPNIDFDMPEEWEQLHHKCLNSLYRGLPMDDDSESRAMILDPKAMTVFKNWSSKKLKEVNAETDLFMIEILSGIYGKIKEYAIRFAGLLHLSDKGYDGRRFEIEEIIREDTMRRAIEAADYFFDAAKLVSEKVNTSVIASPEVIRFASYVKAGFSFQKIGELEYGDEKTTASAKRMKATRMVKKYLQEYPKIFGAEVKS